MTPACTPEEADPCPKSLMGGPDAARVGAADGFAQSTVTAHTH